MYQEWANFKEEHADWDEDELLFARVGFEAGWSAGYAEGDTDAWRAASYN